MRYSWDDLRFELFIPGGADQVATIGEPSASTRMLFEVGVPKRFMIDAIVADPVVTLVPFALPGAPALIRFATYTSTDAIVLEPMSGVILQISYFADLSWPSFHFVSTSLELFNQTVKALTEAFPFDYHDETGEELRKPLEHIIGEIDPSALSLNTADTLWWQFLGDVDIDMYSVDAVLNPSGDAGVMRL